MLRFIAAATVFADRAEVFPGIEATPPDGVRRVHPGPFRLVARLG